MTSLLSSVDRDVIENVLQMEGGYVLNFTNEKFAEFFKDCGVDIYAERYADLGSSKAKRLRSFLRQAEPRMLGRALGDLLRHRLAMDGDPPSERRLQHYRAMLDRLSPEGGSNGESSLDALLQREFDSKLFQRLPIEPAVAEILVARMVEARSCIQNGAHLSAVILCGSVLEGLCLGHGQRHPEIINRGYQAHYSKPAPKLWDWKLSEWIEVLTRLGHLSLNVAKFGHALRDFRNFVHPAEQLAHKFAPDHNTAKIGFHVVVAAAEDLGKATRGVGK